jgi:hypothetical protein
MKIFSVLTIAAMLGVAGFSAAPAMAASSGGGSLSPGQVPYCSSTTAQLDLSKGIYQNELTVKGATLNSVEIWNGCVKALYTSSDGTSSTAIYDPDTLQLLTTLGTPSVS